MGALGISHWLLVLIVVMLIFGTKKLRYLGEDLGRAVKGFKETTNEGQDMSKPGLDKQLLDRQIKS